MVSLDCRYGRSEGLWSICLCFCAPLFMEGIGHGEEQGVYLTDEVLYIIPISSLPWANPSLPLPQLSGLTHIAGWT